MAVKLGDAFVALGTKDELDKGLNAARNKVNGFIANLGQGIAQGIGQAVAQGVGRLIGAGLDQIGKATSAANDLNQAIIRTQKVFGDSADEIRAWAQTADTALGLSEAAALGNASALGNMLTQLGANREQAALMSRQMVETAADLAAFHKVTGGAAAVLETFAAGFRGEYDSLQRFLPAITDAAIKQQALADTGKASADQLTALEKALATQTLIFQGATSAAGAYADAIASGAAAQDEFAARMENARAELGQVGLIIQREFFQTLNELLEEMGFYGENIVEQLVVGLTKGLTAITPFLAQLRGIFTYWLKPGSPPRLLKDLTEWGQGAAKAYLEGWGEADFGALNTLGEGIENALRSFAGAGQLKETDLVARVFGSQRAIVDAINEWRSLGSVSISTLDNVRRAAGPAGDAIGDLVAQYFDLQNATKRAADAQLGLDSVARRYDAALSPLLDKLDDLDDAQQRLSDEKRLEELGKVLRDPRATANQREAARYEIEQIQLRAQIDAIEEERDAALKAEQAKVDAAELERQQKQAIYDQGQLLLEQQIRSNELMAEEITLRTRLADEALAKEEKAARELEAQRKKEEAELERIADAHLRYRLAVADDAGQLAILQEELAKTTEGSADYWAILTDIAQVQERIANAATGGGFVPSITETGKAALENKQYLEDFRLALEGATDALFGGENKETELNPFWQGVADTIGTIGQAAEEAQPFIQGLIDLIMGKDAEGLDTVTDPFGDNWWLSGMVPAVNNLIKNLQLIREGDWSGLWAGFKQYVDEVVEGSAGDEDRTTFGLYSWLQDTAIPALELLAAGEWAEVWQSFADWAMSPFQAVVTFYNEQIAKLQELVQGFMEKYGFPTNPFDPNATLPGSSGSSSLPLPGGNTESSGPLQSLIDRLNQLQTPGMGSLEVLPLQPQGFGATSSESNVFYIEQNIATNGDFGGARQGAQEGIRQALLQRRIQGTA